MCMLCISVATNFSVSILAGFRVSATFGWEWCQVRDRDVEGSVIYPPATAYR